MYELCLAADFWTKQNCRGYFEHSQTFGINRRKTGYGDIVFSAKRKNVQIFNKKPNCVLFSVEY